MLPSVLWRLWMLPFGGDVLRSIAMVSDLRPDIERCTALPHSYTAKFAKLLVWIPDVHKKANRSNAPAYVL
jgi:hypothetical protein